MVCIKSGNWGAVILHHGLCPVFSAKQAGVLEDPPAVSPEPGSITMGHLEQCHYGPGAPGAGKASGHGTHKTPGALLLPRNTDTETVRQTDGSGKHGPKE